MQGASKHALWAVAGLLLLSLVGSGGMMYLLHSDRGNAFLCNYVSSKIGTAFKGSLEIDRIDDLKLDSLVARGVRFIPPRGGPPAIDAPHVLLEFSPLEMIQGEYGWSRAVVDKPVVRVTERTRGAKTNMEELFAGPDEPEGKAKGGAKGRVAMKNMITKDAKLFIGGGSLPKLYLSELDGVMRIDIDEQGDATLRFDEYKGKLDGLPTGALAFRDVKGTVWTGGKHLLHFEGAGKNDGEPVDFDLDISTKPSDVHIGARYEGTSLESMRTRMIAAWSKLSGNIDIDVRRLHD